MTQALVYSSHVAERECFGAYSPQGGREAAFIAAPGLQLSGCTE